MMVFAVVKMDASGPGKAPFSLRDSQVEMTTSGNDAYTHIPAFIHVVIHTRYIVTNLEALCTQTDSSP